MWNALVDQSRRRQLCAEAVAEDFSEPALVMIKPLDLLVIYAAHVDHDVTCIQDGGVSGPLQTY